MILKHIISIVWIFITFSQWWVTYCSLFPRSASVWNPVLFCGSRSVSVPLLDPRSGWDTRGAFLRLPLLRLLGLRWLQIHRHAVSRSALHVRGTRPPVYIHVQLGFKVVPLNQKNTGRENRDSWILVILAAEELLVSLDLWGVQVPNHAESWRWAQEFYRWANGQKTTHIFEDLVLVLSISSVLFYWHRWRGSHSNEDRMAWKYKHFCVNINVTHFYLLESCWWCWTRPNSLHPQSAYMPELLLKTSLILSSYFQQLQTIKEINKEIAF